LVASSVAKKVLSKIQTPSPTYLNLTRHALKTNLTRVVES
jgi:hypothetical protein